MIRPVKIISTTTSIMVAGLLVVACGDGETGPSTTAPSATTPAPAVAAPPVQTLGKTDLSQPLQVLGNEPFWSIAITPASLTFTPVDGAKVMVDNPGPVIQGESATWSNETQTGVVVQVVATLKDCTDGMSDRVYPMSATVKIGDKDFTGCAASLKALETVGESGRVE